MDSGTKHILKKHKAVSVFAGMAFAVLFLWCCSPTFMPPAETDLQWAQKHWSDATHAQLNEGYTIYKNKCGSCHYLYRPDKYSEEKWKQEIPEMGEKAKLDSKQVELITRYILTAKETHSFAKK